MQLTPLTGSFIHPLVMHYFIHVLYTLLASISRPPSSHEMTKSKHIITNWKGPCYGYIKVLLNWGKLWFLSFMMKVFSIPTRDKHGYGAQEISHISNWRWKAQGSWWVNTSGNSYSCDISSLRNLAGRLAKEYDLVKILWPVPHRVAKMVLVSRSCNWTLFAWAK